MQQEHDRKPIGGKEVSSRGGMVWQSLEMLVTVKAYPAISNKYGESVCVAGVRTDVEKPEFIRLFPVGFRALPAESQFKKYQLIKLRVRRGTTDRRPESWQPDLGSIQLGRTVDTARGWKERWEILGPLVGEGTTCDLHREAARVGQAARSLALVKPSDVAGVTVTKNPDFDPALAAAAQVAAAPDLFQTEREVLRAAPYRVQYNYRCEAKGCSGHKQGLIDWEVGAAGLRWRDNAVAAVDKQLGQKFFDDMCGPGKATHFYIGNQHANPGSFMVLGVFYPPKNSQPQPALF
jgi:hypothetical protein